MDGDGPHFSLQLVGSKAAHNTSFFGGKEFTVYEILVSTDIPQYTSLKGTQFSMTHRYQDFCDLHSKLIGIYSQLPQLPPKSVFNRMADETIKTRETAFRGFLDVVSRTPALHVHPLIVEFLTGCRQVSTFRVLLISLGPKPSNYLEKGCTQTNAHSQHYQCPRLRYLFWRASEHP